MPLMTEQHFKAACGFYLALASQMRRSGHIKVATHADKQYRTYRNRLHAKMQLEGSYPFVSCTQLKLFYRQSTPAERKLQ